MKEIPIIFTPGNEPFLGRTLLKHFDDMLIVSMERYDELLKPIDINNLNKSELATYQLVSQTINLAFSIRELIRQGYLFGAKTMFRSLLERSTMLYYFYLEPSSVELWLDGWPYRKAPSLAKMLEVINEKGPKMKNFKGHEFLENHNNVVHGKLESLIYNMNGDKEKLDYVFTKDLSNTKLCDEICADCIPQMVIMLSMMIDKFHKKNT